MFVQILNISQHAVPQQNYQVKPCQASCCSPESNSQKGNIYWKAVFLVRLRWSLTLWQFNIAMQHHHFERDFIHFYRPWLPWQTVTSDVAVPGATKNVPPWRPRAARHPVPELQGRVSFLKGWRFPHLVKPLSQ